ncbi:MAG: DUF3808 domain-containing protein [Bryobacteraceae bacterium]|nr:DUF3808 domain-containing protein [Bryobacteraceae bacterium]
MFASAFLAAADRPLSPGFEHFYNLEYTESISSFRAEVAAQPNSPDSWNHLAQALLYSEMFKAGALESELVSGSNPFVRREKMNPSPEVAKQFDDCLNKALQLTEDRLSKNPKDVASLYSSGVAYGLRANYNYLVRKAWMDALKDATNARKMHNRIIEVDPSFVDARLVQGVHDYLVGSLPWHTKMLGFLAGFRGDRQEGLRNLKLVSEEGNLAKYDAKVLLAAIYRRERRPLEALPLLESVSQRFPRNYLFKLEMVQMYSDAGNKQAALTILDRVESLKKSNAPGASLPFEKIWFYRGNLLFWYRDYDGAIECLRRVTPDTSALDLHTAVVTWMRLGQSFDAKGKRKEALEAYRQAIKTGPQTDAAKESQNYIGSPWKRLT